MYYKLSAVKTDSICSVIGVSNYPSLKLELTLFSYHTISKPNLSELIIEEDSNVESE
jgi:hypothetical protein